MTHIREHWLRRRTTRGSPWSTAWRARRRVITSAALIMVSVFCAFVLNGDPTVKQFGVGMAVAVAVDATVVRCLLVPAVMALLGRARLVVPALARPRPAAASRSRARSGSASATRGRRRRASASPCWRGVSACSPRRTNCGWVGKRECQPRLHPERSTSARDGTGVERLSSIARITFHDPAETRGHWNVIGEPRLTPGLLTQPQFAGSATTPGRPRRTTGARSARRARRPRPSRRSPSRGRAACGGRSRSSAIAAVSRPATSSAVTARSRAVRPCSAISSGRSSARVAGSIMTAVRSSPSVSAWTASQPSPGTGTRARAGGGERDRLDGGRRVAGRVGRGEPGEPARGRAGRGLDVRVGVEHDHARPAAHGQRRRGR